jgi:adenylate cyclase
LYSDASVELVKQRLGVHELPESLVHLIREKAEGNPFYCEELAYSLRDAKLIVIHDGVCEPAPNVDLKQIAFPDKVEDIVISRIDLLSAPQQLALKVASAIGRIFAYQLLSEIHPVREDIPQLMDNLLSKVDLTPLETPEPDLTYMFKHIITQEVSYNLMLFQQRRGLHQAIAEWYETKHGDDLPGYYSTLAYHWNKVAEGPDADPATIDKAIDYLVKAANQAMQNFANMEAGVYFKSALALLAKLPASPERDRQELGIQPLLAYSLVSQRGYGDPEVEATYQRASDLSTQLSDSIPDAAQLAFILYGIFSYHASRGEYPPAQEFADRILSLGQDRNSPMILAMGNQCKGIVSFCQGNLVDALKHAQLSYDIAEPLDRATFFAISEEFQAYTSAWLALTQMLLGYPDQARKTWEHALAITEQQPYPRCFVLGFAFLPQLLHDIPATFARTEELVGISQKYSFVLLGLQGNIFRAWALATGPKEPMGVQILEGTTVVPKFVKLDSFVPWYLALLADGRDAAGNHEGALQALEEAMVYAERAGGNFYLPELFRMKAEILQAQDSKSEMVEQLYREAVSRAQSQSAKWWELRASVSLARFLQRQGRTKEAYPLLREITGWFQEGSDTPDLMQARALLAALP